MVLLLLLLFSSCVVGGVVADCVGNVADVGFDSGICVVYMVGCVTDGCVAVAVDGVAIVCGVVVVGCSAGSCVGIDSDDVVVVAADGVVGCVVIVFTSYVVVCCMCGVGGGGGIDNTDGDVGGVVCV